MSEVEAVAEVFERIREKDGRFHDQAYLFVLAALEYCQERRPVRGHITGTELSWACRDLARDRFGLTALTVLQHWGVHTTQDLGRIVYVLIDVGLLSAQPTDRIEDFHEVYDLATAFEGDYPWSGVRAPSPS